MGRIGLLDENRDLLTDSGEHLEFIFQNASKIRQNARKVKKMAPSRDMSKFDPRCAVCNKGRKTITLKSCARCESVMYCSRKCQKKHWKKHKKICKKLL